MLHFLGPLNFIWLKCHELRLFFRCCLCGQLCTATPRLFTSRNTIKCSEFRQDRYYFRFYDGLQEEWFYVDGPLLLVWNPWMALSSLHAEACRPLQGSATFFQRVHCYTFSIDTFSSVIFGRVLLISLRQNNWRDLGPCIRCLYLHNIHVTIFFGIDPRWLPRFSIRTPSLALSVVPAREHNLNHCQPRRRNGTSRCRKE